MEITDLNRLYLAKGQLKVELIGGVAWLDAGSHESLLQASNFVQTIEERQGLMISCPEEIAFRQGYMESEDLLSLAKELGKTTYSDYLFQLLADENTREGGRT